MRSTKRFGFQGFAMVLGIGCAGVSFAPVASAGAPKCPPGQRPSLGGCLSGAPALRPLPGPGPSASTGSGAAAAKSSAAASAPKTPPKPDESLRPPTLLERADRKLLIEEISRLERLVQATRPKSPDRAALVLRLANAYAELAVLAEHDHSRLEIQIDEKERGEKARQSAPKKP